MTILNRILFSLFLLLTAVPAHAQLPGARLNVPATLEAETRTPAPGKTVTLAFVMTPKRGWHGYWENPGDAGFGMQLGWALPKGVTAAKLRYPVPGTLIISGLMNYVFEERHVLLIDLTIDPAVAAGTRLPIRVRGDWLGCTKDICVPQGDDLSIDLVAGDGAVTQAARARFDGYRSVIPVPLDQSARYSIQGKSIDIAIPFPKTATLDHPYFFPLTANVFAYSAPQSARRMGDWLIITTGLTAFTKGPVEGVLRIGKGQGLVLSATPGAIAAGGDPVVTLGNSASVQNVHSGVTLVRLLGLLGLAILGGLILNLMPCVFPILGLKALALAKAGGDERIVRRDALAYTGGVILSCAALGGVMLGLRAAGQQVGWAFQLQDPAIVLLLVLLMVGVTANLAGLFDLGSVNAGDALTRQSGMAGSFWTGVLAAIVATPCTGPFMAAAMGAALLLPVVPALLLFAGLGFGLALPFLAIAYVPALRRRMPKPGPWLERFRRAMAIPMALTAIALLWLLWRLLGEYGLLIGLVSSILLIFGLRNFGKGQRAGKPMFTMPVLAGVVFIFFIAAKTGLDYVPNPEIGEKSAPDLLQSEVFSEKRLDQYRGEGRRVFVYFTADWCVTCKVNEAAAIEREDTKRAFAGNAITVLKGDFTRRDPAISRFLAQHGRSGVPLYLYYSGQADVQILPQILTKGDLIGLR
jgi:thiol:disulfide interchange protein/DsbC/DsbD-like thiol-disulfide interchange protein